LVAAHSDCTSKEIKGDRRFAGLTLARHKAMWFCRKLTQLSFPQIAQRFGGRDHTTIIAACKRIEKLRAEDPKFRADLDCLSIMLRALDASPLTESPLSSPVG
jgi:chromosomal replication initiator protein